MEEAYGNLNAAYLQIKGMVVIEGFYALIAGFVITTFVFKLVGIIKEMTKREKDSTPCTSMSWDGSTSSA
ncbi:EMC3/TMCO1 family protein [Bacteroides fragilis]|nr:EMC3/TMCO1 family protein [Bacteroides fragilis]